MSLLKAIAACGNSTTLAALCKVSPQHVNMWKKRGVPADRVLTIAAATRYQVVPHDLRPDLYPFTNDGVPAEFHRLEWSPANDDREAAA